MNDYVENKTNLHVKSSRNHVSLNDIVGYSEMRHEDYIKENGFTRERKNYKNRMIKQRL